jgi:hypothetical protein
VGCIAVEVAPDMIEATIPDAPTASQERRELSAYLATWGCGARVEAEVVDE